MTKEGQQPSFFDAHPASGHFTKIAGPFICKNSGGLLVEYLVSSYLFAETNYQCM
jgi:hypothetical protein